MKNVGRLFVLLLLAAVVLGYLGFVAPYGPGRETFVDVPAGTGTAGIAHRLQAAGVIRSALAFDLLRKLRGGTLKAGEYRFEGTAPLGAVYDRVARGDVYTIALTVPEGYNLFDIAQAAQAAGLGTAEGFLAAARRDTKLIAAWSPGAASLEGYLFPDTYRFSRHATGDQMVAAMVKRFGQAGVQIGLLGPAGLKAERLNDSVAHTVTLASLIEKEVAVDAERPLVAGVFENRLKLGMPLATDPSVAYAALLEGRWRGTIYRSDLQSDSAYNTYRHPGLPPGPIANPGVAALKAAMAPAKTEYLYFVADAAGHSRFSVDLQEHAKKVQEYRAMERAGRK